MFFCYINNRIYFHIFQNKTHLVYLFGERKRWTSRIETDRDLLDLRICFFFVLSNQLWRRIRMGNVWLLFLRTMLSSNVKNYVRPQSHSFRIESFYDWCRGHLIGYPEITLWRHIIRRPRGVREFRNIHRYIRVSKIWMKSKSSMSSSGNEIVNRKYILRIFEIKSCRSCGMVYRHCVFQIWILKDLDRRQVIY